MHSLSFLRQSPLVATTNPFFLKRQYMYLSLSDLPSNSLVYLLFTEEKSADNFKTVIDFVKTNMALPGVGVFPGENPEFIVQHLRKAGFPVKAVWAQVSPLQKISSEIYENRQEIS